MRLRGTRRKKKTSTHASVDVLMLNCTRQGTTLVVLAGILRACLDVYM